MIDYISSLLSDQTAHAICWTIIHSLWQASFVALVMSFYLKKYQHESSVIRYRISVMSLLFVLGFAISTFLYYYVNFGNDPIIQLTVGGAGLDSEIQNATVTSNSIFSISRWISQYFYVIASVWILGVVLFSLRMIGSLIYIHQLKSKIINKVHPQLNLIFNSVISKLQINETIHIAESKMVSTPMVIGFLKPMILIPVGLINQLETEEVEAILIHELSHITRNDYLYNLLISIVEMCFYFHPAVWWISANIRSERENCCDDAVIHKGKNTATYAKALFKLENIRQQRIPQLAMPLSSNKNQLLHRIQRIINQPQNKSQIKEKLVATVLLFTALIGITHSTSTFHKQEGKAYVFNTIDIESEIPELISIVADIKPIPKLDTIPNSNKTVIFKSDDEKELELKMENGEITELKINGEVIDEADYEEHLEQKDDHLFFNGDVAVWSDAIKIQSDKIEWIQSEVDSALQRFENSHSLRLRKHFGDEGQLKRLLEKAYPSRFMESEDRAEQMEKLRERQSEFKSRFKELFDHSDTSKNVFVFPKGHFNFGDSDFPKIEMDSFFQKHFEGSDRFVFPHEFPDVGGIDHEQLERLLERSHKQLEFDFDHESKLPFRFHFDDSGMNLSERIINALRKDQLIEDSENTSIEISGKHFKINGKKQPENIHNKYKKIAEEVIGHPLTKDTKFKFQTNSIHEDNFSKKKRMRI